MCLNERINCVLDKLGARIYVILGFDASGMSLVLDLKSLIIVCSLKYYILYIIDCFHIRSTMTIHFAAALSWPNNSTFNTQLLDSIQCIEYMKPKCIFKNKTTLYCNKSMYQKCVCVHVYGKRNKVLLNKPNYFMVAY